MFEEKFSGDQVYVEIGDPALMVTQNFTDLGTADKFEGPTRLDKITIKTGVPNDKVAAALKSAGFIIDDNTIGGLNAGGLSTGGERANFRSLDDVVDGMSKLKLSGDNVNIITDPQRIAANALGKYVTEQFGTDSSITVQTTGAEVSLLINNKVVSTDHEISGANLSQQELGAALQQNDRPISLNISMFNDPVKKDKFPNGVKAIASDRLGVLPEMLARELTKNIGDEGLRSGVEKLLNDHLHGQFKEFQQQAQEQVNGMHTTHVACQIGKALVAEGVIPQEQLEAITQDIYQAESAHPLENGHIILSSTTDRAGYEHDTTHVTLTFSDEIFSPSILSVQGDGIFTKEGIEPQVTIHVIDDTVAENITNAFPDITTNVRDELSGGVLITLENTDFDKVISTLVENGLISEPVASATEEFSRLLQKPSTSIDPSNLRDIAQALRGGVVGDEDAHTGPPENGESETRTR